MKKKIVLMLSRVFPITHSRKGEPTDFAYKLKFNEKIHTIRRNFDLWKVNAEKMERSKFYLSVRQWSGKPYKSRQTEIAQIYNAIGVQSIELYYHADNNTITAKIDGRNWLDADCSLIAKNDGLNTKDFKEWFFGVEPKEDKIFNGVIIHFTNFRY